MATIILKGWKVGMRGIPFIFLLKEKLGLSLKKSKDIKERVVNGETVKLTITDLATGQAFIENANDIGVICELEK